MKKITVLSAVTMVSALMFAVPVFADTTVVFTPSTVNVAEGAKFSVVLAVDSKGTNNYVEKLVLNYPANQLEVVSFTQSPNWMAVPTQAGYDLIDNTKGVLIKTAGYANGISAKTDFGTIVFKAKTAGPATITVGTDSLAYEKTTQTAISGAGVTVTVAAQAPVVTSPTPTVTSTVSEKAVTKTTQPTVAPQTTVSAQPAAVANSGVSVGTKAGYIVLGLVVLLAGAWLGYKKSQENKDSNTQ